MCLINSILIVLSQELSCAKLNILFQICKSILTCSNKVTMLEISRYTKVVYRTIQRFFSITNLAWEKLNFALIKCFIWRENKVFLLAADEVVEKKSGKNTHGLSHFFSNIEKQPIPSVAFMSISLIDTETRKSYPIATKQVIKPAKEKQINSETQKITQTKRPKGRPKGSKNKPKKTSTDVLFSILNELLKIVISLFATNLGTTPVYLTLDGYFGNQHYMSLVKSYKLDLISKLKVNSSLFLPYKGENKRLGRPSKYGEKINVKNPPNKFCKAVKKEDKFIYNFYQMNLWSKSYTDEMLNVVIIVSKNTKTGNTATCILFSTDLSLSYEKIVEYYGLRFQIEFNFRDAKQYFGLADFKNYKEVQVTNAVNLSLFLCNFSYILIKHFKEQFNLDVVSILDIKTYYRTEYIANETLNLKNKEKKALKYLMPVQIFNIAKNQAINF